MTEYNQLEQLNYEPADHEEFNNDAEEGAKMLT